MDRESILMFNLEKGFGERFWIICPSCWNSMKLTMWEDGSREEECASCTNREREIMKP